MTGRSIDPERSQETEIVRDLIKPSTRLTLPDFERRRMSVIVKDEDGVVSMVTKGALEEMSNM